MDIQAKPTQEGFYWLNDSRRYGWEVVRVFMVKNEKEYYFESTGISSPDLCRDYNQWVGPLDMPVSK